MWRGWCRFMCCVLVCQEGGGTDGDGAAGAGEGGAVAAVEDEAVELALPGKADTLYEQAQTTLVPGGWDEGDTPIGKSNWRERAAAAGAKLEGADRARAFELARQVSAEDRQAGRQRMRGGGREGRRRTQQRQHPVTDGRRPQARDGAERSGRGRGGAGKRVEQAADAGAGVGC
jgi:hypothetical protein